VSKLFIGNLSFKTTEAELIDHCVSKGIPVESVKIPTDQMTGRSRGVGFVELGSIDEAFAIELLHGNNLGGRDIRVERAKEQRRRSDDAPRRGERRR